MHVRRATDAARLAEEIPATLMVFDLLRLDGEDLTGRPWPSAASSFTGLGLASRPGRCRVVRRRRDAVGGDPSAGPRGGRQQAGDLAHRFDTRSRTG